MNLFFVFVFVLSLLCNILVVVLKTLSVHWTENHRLWLRSVQLQFDIFKKFHLVLVLWQTRRSFILKACDTRAILVIALVP